MIDVAGGLMAQGREVALARVQGVDDNMARPHRHDHVEIYLLEEGRREHHSQGRVYRIAAPEVIVFPPGNEHFSRSAPGEMFRRTVVYARPEAVLYPWLREHYAERIRVIRPRGTGLAQIRACVEEMLHAQEALGAQSGDELRLQTTRLLLMLAREEEFDAADEARGDRISRVLDYLHVHYTEHIDLGALAQLFFVSPHHLAREFRRRTGSSIIGYVNALRVDQAQRLLHETDLTVAEIAQQVGCGTRAHFHRIFRAYTGRTPRQVRAERPGLSSADTGVRADGAVLRVGPLGDNSGREPH